MYLFKRASSIYRVLFILFLLSPPAYSSDILSSNPIEVGKVRWGRDLNGAFEQSKVSGKPIFLLFQEVPGCLGCKEFGKNVLRHDLLVEAIETLFHPVLVYNNRPGTPDEKILRQFDEPSWNYQVIRFLDGNGKDIIPRKDKVWTIGLLAYRMIKVLEKLQKPVPLYLKSIEQLHFERAHKNVAFAMACFWTGEYKLGKIDGVITTEAGWYDNREVTLVTYNRHVIDLSELVALAAKEKCAQRVYLPSGERLDRSFFDSKVLNKAHYRKASQDHQKKQLTSIPNIRNISNINGMQLTKMNSLLPDSYPDALQWLSPRQTLIFLRGTKAN